MEWETVRSSAAQYFGALVPGSKPDDPRNLSPDNVLKLSTESEVLYVGPIDWTWGTDQEIATTLDKWKLEYALHCNQVETLIREAATLIERALADVLKYDQLNLERFKLVMELAASRH